ncbi:MAG TPA: ATP-binding protein [Tenuifilaceae bacterium]|nr:ATP-binding protein [Tenuifilaceae bacterium]HPE17179.1 ATP-binding protein [Tenuifilaceae bacterium]HPQ33292.1 ATP-binding protein [Tenuifilaceae bacterium]HRX67578.1 ATP-binding protein [Tenuifilaceae bacterium]
MIKRFIKTTIEKQLFKKKVVLLYGARRVGKTTIVKQISNEHDSSKYINCELLQNKSALQTTNTELLKAFIGNFKLVVLDEAQDITEIGKVLKVLVDTYPDMQILATGSSSFELSQQVGEPLTGRSRQFTLYPFSFSELVSDRGFVDTHALLENILRFGMYPEVWGKVESEAIEELQNIASNYLYKDILQFERIRRPDMLINLLRALALQIGNEVSLNELANLLGENINTIKRYIELLEKAFVIFRLPSFARNLRKEIAKGQKIYFYDLGIRNALIQNFNNLAMRNDKGALWENFFVAERMKHNHYNRKFVNCYFWRTYDQQEIDYIEEHSGKLTLFECKYNPAKKAKIPTVFKQNYPDSELFVVTPENYWQFFEAV